MRCNDLLHGPRHERRGLPGLQFAYALELQRRRVLHCHAVLGDPSIDLTAYKMAGVRREMHQLWYKQHGIPRLEVADSVEATAVYLCKYVVKEGEFELSHRVDCLASGAPVSLLARSAESTRCAHGGAQRVDV
jgi:hypothetical protein